MMTVLHILGFVLLVGFLGLVMYGACRDERDNMRGGCKAAAIRRKRRRSIKARFGDFAYNLAVAIIDGDLLKLRSSWRRQHDESIGIHTHTGNNEWNGAGWPEQNSRRLELKSRRRADFRCHYRSIGRDIVQFFSITRPGHRATNRL